MSEKYKLTNEEINKAVLHSPYALADSPYKKGLGAAQIKKFFYDFIVYLANSIKTQNYITTISIHVHSINKNEKAQEISDKQAKVITDLLVKNGVNKDNIIVASYANTSPLIGWEGKDRVEIGFLLEK